MGDWLLNLPIPWMAVVIFAAIYLIAACVYLLVVRLAVGDRTRAFKAFSPGMLPVLGTIFALLVAFVAVQVWNDFDKAKLAVATEASALRAVDVFAETLPDEQRTQLRALMNRHIEEAVNREWPAMAHERLTLASWSTHLVEAQRLTVLMKPQDESQRTAQGDRGCVAKTSGCAASAHHHQSIRGRAGEVGCNPATGTLHAHCDCHCPQR